MDAGRQSTACSSCACADILQSSYARNRGRCAQPVVYILQSSCACARGKRCKARGHSKNYTGRGAQQEVHRKRCTARGAQQEVHSKRASCAHAQGGNMHSLLGLRSNPLKGLLTARSWRYPCE
eukprot:scaffold79926_cov23-Tisochrysis_lutea.AAC.2